MYPRNIERPTPAIDASETSPDLLLSFLFTDIEGSTKMWEAHPQLMGRTLAHHDALMRAAIESAGGRVFKTVGDAFCAVFQSPESALAGAMQAQLSLFRAQWPEETPIRVRMAVHTGVAERRDNDYFGQTLNRVARIQSTAHGGQTILSETTVQLLGGSLEDGMTLLDMGRHRLKDLGKPEVIHQVVHPELPNEFPPLRSLDAPETRHNLPLQATSFVGRKKEIADVTNLLRTNRLVTLTGAGGGGKTRLALQSAVDRVEEWKHGVWLVELAALDNEELVPQTVAGVLGVREEPGRDISRSLVDHLKTRELLLIIDNCEHLVQSCADLVADILASCPKVSVLVTSREPLSIAGEATYTVPSLALPDPRKTMRLSALQELESVRLFADRASQVQPSFSVTEQNARAVASICLRLDGIPLALELAAARVRAMSVQDIERRLDQSFRLLTGGLRTALPRQQTLRSLIDWSYDLLNPSEKSVLLRLSVFAGGWTMESAEAVVSGGDIDEWDVVDIMTSLADKSLIVVEQEEKHPRYRLLETVRQYCREKLEGQGEAGSWHSRHFSHFLSLAKSGHERLKGPSQGEFLRQLDEEIDNLRVAIDWGSANGMAHEALDLTSSLWLFWYYRGYFTEGRDRILRTLALDAFEGDSVRAQAHYAAGSMANNLGDAAQAAELTSESLRLAREVGDRELESRALNGLGRMAVTRGHYSAAREFFFQGLASFKEIGDEWGVALQLTNLSDLAFRLGEFKEAETMEEESVKISRRINNETGVARSLAQLGMIQVRLGDSVKAEDLLSEGMALGRSLGDFAALHASLNGMALPAINTGDWAKAREYVRESMEGSLQIGHQSGYELSLRVAGKVYLGEGSVDQAARLWGAAESLRAELGLTIPPCEESQYSHLLSTARDALGQERFESLWKEGIESNRTEIAALILV